MNHLPEIKHVGESIKDGTIGVSNGAENNYTENNDTENRITNGLPTCIRVLKFGGSSVGTPENIRNVVRVVQNVVSKRRAVVVISALPTVTDDLEEMIADGADLAVQRLMSLYRRHLKMARALLPRSSVQGYRRILGSELAAVVPSIRRIRQRAASHFDLDSVRAAGERFSVPLIAEAMNSAGLRAIPTDATRLVRVLDRENHGIDEHETRARIRDWYAALPASQVPVVTGFIGATPCGRTVTLGRGGSDFTAALLASALTAELLERWTDVDGLYSSDPRRSHKAIKYEVLRMEDAALLNRAERLGMHRHTLEPLLRSHTPLHVRSFSSPGRGTLIIPSGNDADVPALSK